VAGDDGDSPVVLVLAVSSVPGSRLSSFGVRPHPSTRGGARVEVGWATCVRVRVGCPGTSFWSFRGFGRLFAFAFVTAGRRRGQERGGWELTGLEGGLGRWDALRHLSWVVSALVS
jgi:hypothetical protein